MIRKWDYGLVQRLYEQGAKDQALERFDLAIRLHPASADAAINKAITLDALSRRQEATEAWRHAISLIDDDLLQQQIQRRISASN